MKSEDKLNYFNKNKYPYFHKNTISEERHLNAFSKKGNNIYVLLKFPATLAARFWDRGIDDFMYKFYYIQKSDTSKRNKTLEYLNSRIRRDKDKIQKLNDGDVYHIDNTLTKEEKLELAEEMQTRIVSTQQINVHTISLSKIEKMLLNARYGMFYNEDVSFPSSIDITCTSNINDIILLMELNEIKYLRCENVKLERYIRKLRKGK